MSARIPEIGRCIGCDRSARLYDGVCEACLSRRGRKWAVMSYRCRTDPEFALAVYASITTDRGRELFLTIYGNASLRGQGNTIAELRDRAARTVTWSWEPELTIPPGPREPGALPPKLMGPSCKRQS